MEKKGIKNYHNHANVCILSKTVNRSVLDVWRNDILGGTMRTEQPNTKQKQDYVNKTFQKKDACLISPLYRAHMHVIVRLIKLEIE